MIQDLWQKKPDCARIFLFVFIINFNFLVSHYVTRERYLVWHSKHNVKGFLHADLRYTKCFMVIANMKTIFHLMNNQIHDAEVMNAGRARMNSRDLSAP
jgi:hypothetical protein